MGRLGDISDKRVIVIDRGGKCIDPTLFDSMFPELGQIKIPKDTYLNVAAEGINGVLLDENTVFVEELPHKVTSENSPAQHDTPEEQRLLWESLEAIGVRQCIVSQGKTSTALCSNGYHKDIDKDSNDCVAWYKYLLNNPNMIVSEKLPQGLSFKDKLLLMYRKDKYVREIIRLHTLDYGATRSEIRNLVSFNTSRCRVVDRMIESFDDLILHLDNSGYIGQVALNFLGIDRNCEKLSDTSILTNEISDPKLREILTFKRHGKAHESTGSAKGDVNIQSITFSFDERVLTAIMLTLFNLDGTVRKINLNDAANEERVIDAIREGDKEKAINLINNPIYDESLDIGSPGNKIVFQKLLSMVEFHFRGGSGGAMVKFYGVPNYVGDINRLEELRVDERRLDKEFNEMVEIVFKAQEYANTLYKDKGKSDKKYRSIMATWHSGQSHPFLSDASGSRTKAAFDFRFKFDEDGNIISHIQKTVGSGKQKRVTEEFKNAEYFPQFTKLFEIMRSDCKKAIRLILEFYRDRYNIEVKGRATDGRQKHYTQYT